MSSFVYHFKAFHEFKLELQSRNATFQSKLVFFSRDIKIWQMTLKNNKTPLLSYFKLCVSFHSHMSIQNGVTAWKLQIWVKIDDFFVPVDLEIWWMTLKHNRATLLCYFKLCVSFHRHLSIQNGVTVRKHPIWVEIGDFLSGATLILHRWPW